MKSSPIKCGFFYFYKYEAFRLIRVGIYYCYINKDKPKLYYKLSLIEVIEMRIISNCKFKHYEN